MKFLVATVFAVACLGLSSVNAATVTLNFGGNVVSGIDTFGHFGSVGGDLSGQTFSILASFDDTIGATDPFAISSYGGLSGGPVGTILTELSVGGTTYTFPTYVNAYYYASYALRRPEPSARGSMHLAQNAGRSLGDYFFFTADSDSPVLTSGGMELASNVSLGRGLLRFEGQGRGPILDYIQFNVRTASVDTPPPIDMRSVPEPASWALMIGGFGLVGTTLRRSRRIAPTLES